MIDYLGYILVRFLSFILCILPLRLGLLLGRCLGMFAFMFNRKRGIIAYANLKAAFSSEKSPAEIKKIVRGVYRNLGQVLIEMLRFPVINKGYINKYISMNGFERIKEARSKNKGVITLTGHFGNWELLTLVGGFVGFPLSVLAREQRHTRLNELLNSYRELAGCRVIKKGLATRHLIKALRSGEVVGMLADQDAGRLGTFVNFFGRPTSNHNGAFVFAQKTGAVVLPAFIVREKGPYHRIDVLESIELKDNADINKEIHFALQKFSNIFESYIRSNPEQWLWLHKRWKSTPYRSIIILNDGKAGHLNQSIAVANIIQRYREDRGYGIENTPYKIIDVNYKNRFSRFMLGLCSNFSSQACQGCMACVKLCLKRDSFNTLISSYADIIISCGASLAPVNVFLTRELNAKNAVIMKPTLIGLRKFNLAIIPRHDNPKVRTNILATFGSPNRITQEEIQKEALRFLSFIDLKKTLRLGLILGGDNPDYGMEPALMREIISQIKSVSEKLGLEILATTSRRTPKAIDLLLKDELAKFASCKLLVIANERNIEGTIPAILGLCSVVLVSGESISMISEAASSGRSVLVFPLKKKKAKHTKHERVVEELNRLGFVKSVEIDRVSEEIEQVLNSKIAPKRLNDYDAIYNAVGNLL